MARAGSSSTDPSATRARIRAIAIELFQRNGFDATGIRELGDAAGLGAGALYHYIGSKEVLLFDISMELVRDALDGARAVLAERDDPAVRLRALAEHLVTHIAQRQGAWSVTVNEVRALTDDHRAQVTAARDEYEALWISVLAAGASMGLWREVTRIELRGILGMFNSTRRWLDPTGSQPPEQVAGRYVDLLLNGLRPRPTGATAATDR